MSLRVEQTAGGSHLVLQGVVDAFKARELHQAAVAAQNAGGKVTVNLAEVTRLDTSAIQILLALSRGLQAEGRSYHLEGMPPTVRENCQLLGLTTL